jgi:hypothetical protein
MNPPSISTASRNSRGAIAKLRPLPLSSPPLASRNSRRTCQPRRRPRYRPRATAAAPSRPRSLPLSSLPPASRKSRRTCQPRPHARGIHTRLLREAPSHPNLLPSPSDIRVRPPQHCLKIVRRRSTTVETRRCRCAPTIYDEAMFLQ